VDGVNVKEGLKMDIKIPFYNLVNMLLIGIIFIVGLLFIDTSLMDMVLGYIQSYNISSSLVLFVLLPVSYQVGLIINRLGSLLEDILKTKKTEKNRGWISRIFQFTWRSYELYQKTEKIEPFVKTLSREYALSRNSLTLFLLLAIVAFAYEEICLASAMIVVSALFYFSMRKHAQKIVARIDLFTNPNSRR
jgi:hypothetical protein